MSKPITDQLLRQYEIAWSLLTYHLKTLTTEECLWRPSTKGLHVALSVDNRWHGEWPDHEGYDLGPPSIAWLVWHIGFWWSMTINHSFEDSTFTREAAACPGDAAEIRTWLQTLNARWRELVSNLDDEALRSDERTKWPFQDQPFGDVIAWVNIELTKNASELGYARFLYATRD